MGAKKSQILVMLISGPRILSEELQAFQDDRLGVSTDEYVLADPTVDQSSGFDSLGQYLSEIKIYFWQTRRSLAIRMLVMLGIAGFLGLIPNNNQDSGVVRENIKSLLYRFSTLFYYKHDIYSLIFGTFFVIITIWYSVREFRKKNLSNLKILLITLWLYYLGLFVHGNPPYHYYTPIILIFPILVGSVEDT